MKIQRLAWVDVCKGFAIVLMVYGHVVQGAAHRGTISETFYQISNSFIYSFHMYVFFFAAGCFLADLWTRRWFDVVKSRAGSLLWPYVVWGLIALALEPFLIPFKSDPAKMFSYAQAFSDFATGSSSWFLYTLFVCHLLLIVCYFVNIWAVLLVAVAVQLWVDYADPAPDIVQIAKIATFLPFFLFGIATGRRALELGEMLARFSRARATLSLLATVSVQALLVLYLTPMLSPPAATVAADIAALNGIVMVTALALALRETPIFDMFRVLGVASIAIFLLHPYFQGASRLVVSRTLGDAPAISTIVQTVIASVAPTLIYYAARAFHGSWLFTLPVTTQRPAVTAQQAA